MSGSAGGYIPKGVSPKQVSDRTREAEAQSQGEAFKTEVGEWLAGLLADYNSRDTDATQTALSEIVADIGGLIDGSIATLFGGSVSKRTYVDGVSDVDALVL